MTLSSKHRGFGQSSRIALAVALAIPGGVALPAVAQAQEAQQDFSIAGGDLGAALQRYSAATDVQLVYSSDLVAGKRSPGVSGRMSPQQALGQLLAGSGLSARVQGNTATLVQAGASGDVAADEGERLLGPVRVEGSQGASGTYQAPVRGDGIAQLGGIRGGQDEEAVGYRAKVASISTGAAIAIEDIPRSVTVQTQEQIEKQDIVSLSDALERLPGIVIRDDTGTIFSRGYTVSRYQVDGGVGRDLKLGGAGQLSLDAYERVELVRGPNALFAGAESPGGTINLVRKRPGAAKAISIDANAGSFGRWGLVTDYSIPSIFGTAIAFRGVASYRRDGEEYDNFDHRNLLVSGLFDIPMGESARLEVGASYNDVKAKGAYNGVPRYFDGPLIDLPRTFNISDKSEGDRLHSSEIFSKLFVDVAEDWDLEIGASYVSGRREYRGLDASVNLISTDNEAFFPGHLQKFEANPSASKQLGIDAKLTGRFDTFGLKHNIFLSAVYSEKDDFTSLGGRGVYAIAEILKLDDIINPVYVDVPAPEVLPTILYSGQRSKNTGLIIGDTVSWRDVVSVTASLRKDMISDAYVLTTGGTDGSENSPEYSTRTLDFNDSNAWRPSFSATIKPIKNLTLYASYADGFSRQDSFFRRSGTAPNYVYEPLMPTTYTNKEVGIKYAESNWLASASLFHMKNKNAAYGTGIQECPPFNALGPLGSSCYDVNDDSYSKGFDIDLNGEIANGLSISANFNFVRQRTTPLEGPRTVTSFLPTKSGSIFVDWRPNFSKNLTVQLGGRYRSRIYQAGTQQNYDADHNPIPCPGNDCSFEFSEEPYAVFDLGMSYRISEQLGLRLFVENITDKTYLSTVTPATTGGNFYGRPRTFMASLKWQNIGPVPEGGRSPTNGLAPFGKASNWYAGFGIGYAAAPVFDAKAKGEAQDNSSPVIWNFHTRDQPLELVNIGYRITENVRIELEGSHRSSQFTRIGGNMVAPFGVCGNENAYSTQEPFNCEDVPGQTESWSLITSAIYDFGKRDGAFRPYIGLGGGLARYAVGFQGKMDGIGGETPWATPYSPCCGIILYTADPVRESQEFVGAQDTSSSFAWQAMLGTSLKLSERMEFDISYRYFNIPSMKWNVYNKSAASFDGTLPLTPALESFKGSYATHSLSIGLRWAFGRSGN